MIISEHRNNNSVTEITYNDLIIGKTYIVSAATQCSLDSNPSLQLSDGEILVHSAGNGGAHSYQFFDENIIFKATTTSITLTAKVATGYASNAYMFYGTLIQLD